MHFEAFRKEQAARGYSGGLLEADGAVSNNQVICLFACSSRRVRIEENGWQQRLCPGGPPPSCPSVNFAPTGGGRAAGGGAGGGRAGEGAR